MTSSDPLDQTYFLDQFPDPYGLKLLFCYLSLPFLCLLLWMRSQITLTRAIMHMNEIPWKVLRIIKLVRFYQNKICWLYLLSLDKQTRVYCGKAVLNLIAIITNLLNHQWSFNMMPCALETPTSEMRWNWSNLKTRLCMYMLSKWGANQNKALCICSLLGRIWLNEIWTLRITKSLRAKPGGREKIRISSGVLHETSNSQ